MAHHNEEDHSNRVKTHQKNFLCLIFANICQITKWILLIFQNALFFSKSLCILTINIIYVKLSLHSNQNSSHPTNFFKTDFVAPPRYHQSLLKSVIKLRLFKKYFYQEYLSCMTKHQTRNKETKHNFLRKRL